MAFPNSPTTWIRSQLGAINSRKWWGSVVFIGLVLCLSGLRLLQSAQPQKTWRLQTNSVIGEPDNPLSLNWLIAQDQKILFNTTAGHTVAVDQDSGKIIWLRQTDANSPFPPFLIDDATVGVLTLSSEVFAFESHTGKTKWIFQPEFSAQPDGPALVDETMIYFADRSGKLYALNKTTGEQNWQLQFKTLPIEAQQSKAKPLDHFGVITQSESQLLINHAVEKALITVDKKTGQRLASTSQTQIKKIESLPNQEFALCMNQTALCKNGETSHQPIILLTDFLQKQQRFSAIKKLLPKIPQPLKVISAPTQTTTDQPIDWNFEFSDLTVNNIWTEVTTQLTLTEKSTGEKITLAAYPLNYTHWRATAKIPSEGEWSWQLVVHSPEHHQKAQGSLRVNPTTQPQTFSWPGVGFQDGFLDLNSNDDYFDQMYLGTLTQPVIDPAQATITNFETYLKTYANPESGFTAFRWSVDNFNFKIWREISENNFQLSLKGGQDGDRLVRAIAAHNLTLDLDVFGFQPPFATEKQLTAEQLLKLKRYLKYIVGRYGAFVTSWEIGNEVRPSDAWVGAVAAALKEVDPYKHPISINWQRDLKLGLDFISLHHYYSLAPHLTQDEFLAFTAPYTEQKQPVTFSEIGNHDLSWDSDSADRFRIRVWTAFMSQTPVYFWLQNGPLFNNPGNNANTYIGPTERVMLATFRKLTTATSSQWSTTPIASFNPKLTALALKNDKNVWIYVTATEKKSISQGLVTLLETPVTTITWYDPATGKVLQKSNKLLTPLFSQDVVGIATIAPP